MFFLQYENNILHYQIDDQSQNKINNKEYYWKLVSGEILPLRRIFLTFSKRLGEKTRMIKS